jgi:hypothetical protein
MSNRHFAVAFVACISLGCSTSTSPVDDTTIHTSGTFNLYSANNSTLPAQVFAGLITGQGITPFNLRVVATTGSFTIDANNHYEQRVDHDAFIDGVLGARNIHSDHGDCTRAGAELHCTSTYLEFVEFTAVFGRNTVTITQDLVGEGHAATYLYTWAASGS